MLRSMYSGIGGMRNFQTKLDVIGNNIANVNTFGYKKGRTTFKDLVSQQLSGASNPTATRGGTNPRQVGLGGTMATIDTIHTQGSLQTTGRALDLGISGDGFFIVNNGDLSYYTRAGNFYLDREGTLVTGDGLKVQGFRPDPATGLIDRNNFGDLQIKAGDFIAPQATTAASLKGNLNAETLGPGGFTPAAYAFTTGQVSQVNYDSAMQNSVSIRYTVIDSLGAEHNVNMVFQKTGTANTWTLGVLTPGTAPNPYLYTQLANNVTFDSAGNITGPMSVQLSVATTNGSQTPINTPGLIRVDLSSLSQFAASNTVDIDQIDGNFEGFLESFNISQTGEINGIYTNGEVRILGQIAMATFNNTGGLTKSGDNLFQVSNNSGFPNVGFAGEGRGIISGSSLEMSNVDLSEEFTEMIVAQRGFQANTRIITTSDEILQELVNLKR